MDSWKIVKTCSRSSNQKLKKGPIKDRRNGYIHFCNSLWFSCSQKHHWYFCSNNFENKLKAWVFVEPVENWRYNCIATARGFHFYEKPLLRIYSDRLVGVFFASKSWPASKSIIVAKSPSRCSNTVFSVAPNLWSSMLAWTFKCWLEASW